MSLRRGGRALADYLTRQAGEEAAPLPAFQTASGPVPDWTDPAKQRRARGMMATGPHMPDPDAGRARAVEPDPGVHFATGERNTHPALRVPSRREEDPPDPYGPEGDAVPEDVDAGAAAVLRERYDTLPDGQPSGRITIED
jgi:hypothetical protein